MRKLSASILKLMRKRLSPGLWTLSVIGAFSLVLLRLAEPLYGWPKTWYVLGTGLVCVVLFLPGVIYFARRVRLRA